MMDRRRLLKITTGGGAAAAGAATGLTAARSEPKSGAAPVGVDRVVRTTCSPNCTGCRYCMAACPYGVRVFNWGEAERSPGVEEGMISPRPVGTVEKCTFCVHRVAEDQVPSCVWSCPAQARIFGDLNDPDSRISTVLRDRDGEQMLAEKGTKPKVYYLKPRRRRSL